MPSFSFLDNIRVVGSWPTPTIQSAIDSAKVEGFAVVIPALYKGNDTFEDPEGVCIIDFRTIKNGGTGLSGPISQAAGINFDCGTF